MFLKKIQYAYVPCLISFPLKCLQEVYDRGFSAMERSHQKVLIEMRKTHKREFDQLRQEKDQQLAEETKATQAGE